MSEARRKLLSLFRSRSAPDPHHSADDKPGDGDDDGDGDDGDGDGDGNALRGSGGRSSRRQRRSGDDLRAQQQEKQHHHHHHPHHQSHHHYNHYHDRHDSHERERRGSRPQSRRHSVDPQQQQQRYDSQSSLSERKRSITALPVPLPIPIPQQIRPALTEWPPPGYAHEAMMPQGRAMELICTGAPVFRGQQRPVPHASGDYYTLYASCDGTGDGEHDGRDAYHAAFNAATFRMFGIEPAQHPWETLEHPSMAFCYGTRPGSITLNQWISLSDRPHPSFQLRDVAMKPKEITLTSILNRLRYIEGGFSEDSPDLMYKALYKYLLKDPERYTNPHKGMEKQIADLITVLSRPDWIDFSQAKNQVVAKFFNNATYTDTGRFKTFFHQLLLSLELDFRIHSKEHAVWAQEKLLGQLPPQIAWNLAFAKRWHDCMHIEKAAGTGDREEITYRFRNKKRQVKAIRKFARAMKWPNLVRVDEVLRERDPTAPPLEERSSDAMSYISGVILPGPTLPFLLMNTLIDCDADASALTALTHMQPACGFQYKSTTYWTSTCIVGKVLAPTCQEIGGWIGPARPAPDLSRTQIARIRQRRSRQNVTIKDVETMTVRSDALGPPPPLKHVAYPVQEYSLLLPDGDDIVDTVRIEKLALKVVNSSSPSSPAGPNMQAAKGKDPARSRSSSKKRGTPPDSSPVSANETTKPQTFDACVQFAISGKSWPLRLSYDVSFVAAYPCAHGPHPLFFDYVYKTVKVDEILTIRDWGGLNGGESFGGASSRSRSKSRDRAGDDNDDDDDDDLDPAAREERDAEMIEADEREKVLCIEAFGVADNEVLARAWCSHWGLSAVVADLERTCMSCAIREAYAACITVCILVEGTPATNIEVAQ